MTGASLGIGVGFAMLAGAFVRGDPNEFLLFVAGLGLTIGALYFMTWRGRLWASIALIILTFAVLAIGLLVFFGMFIADQFRLGAGLVAMAALAIGWTGIPLLVNAIRGSRTEIETARDRAVSR